MKFTRLLLNPHLHIHRVLRWIHLHHRVSLLPQEVLLRIITITTTIMVVVLRKRTQCRWFEVIPMKSMYSHWRSTWCTRGTLHLCRGSNQSMRCSIRKRSHLSWKNLTRILFRQSEQRFLRLYCPSILRVNESHFQLNDYCKSRWTTIMIQRRLQSKKGIRIVVLIVISIIAMFLLCRIEIISIRSRSKQPRSSIHLCNLGTFLTRLIEWAVIQYMEVRIMHSRTNRFSNEMRLLRRQSRNRFLSLEESAKLEEVHQCNNRIVLCRTHLRTFHPGSLQ